MKLIPQLVFAAASLSISFATLEAKSVSAAIINYTFSVDSPTTKGNGFFSFDDSTFSEENPVAVKLLDFKFDGDSTVYTEQDDINYPDFPLVYSTLFSPGKSSLGLDYTFDNKTNPSSSIRYEIIGEDFTLFSTTSPDVEVVSGTVSYTRVPEPTTLVGILACGLSLMMNKKLVSLKKVKA